MGNPHLPFLLEGISRRSKDDTACQELNSVGNRVAAALQSLTRRKPN